MTSPALGATLFGVALAAGPVTAAPPTPEALVAEVRAAIEASDLEALEQIVNWSGVSPYRKRIVTFELRHQFGRPIAEMRLEPFPAGGLDALGQTGRLAVNMPVSHRLKLIYDQPPMEQFGIPPTAVFLLGPDTDGYKVALVVRKPAPDRD